MLQRQRATRPNWLPPNTVPILKSRCDTLLCGQRLHRETCTEIALLAGTDLFLAFEVQERGLPVFEHANNLLLLGLRLKGAGATSATARSRKLLGLNSSCSCVGAGRLAAFLPAEVVPGLQAIKFRSPL